MLMDCLSGPWLIVDALPLECDGLTRIVSTLMQRDHVVHRVHVGHVEILGVGLIPHHWWIELTSGHLCDLRARMWLGSDDRVPHGIFEPQIHHRYVSQDELQPSSIQLSPALFHALSSRPIEAFPVLLFPALPLS